MAEPMKKAGTRDDWNLCMSGSCAGVLTVLVGLDGPAEDSKWLEDSSIGEGWGPSLRMSRRNER